MAFKARMDSADRKELAEILSHNYELVKDRLGYSPYVSICTGPIWEANKIEHRTMPFWIDDK